MPIDFAELDRQNITQGKCPRCGGDGVIADMGAIARTGDPHINRRCGHCRGTGKPT